MRVSASWLTSVVIGLTVTVTVLSGSWRYLVVASLGIIFVLFTLVYPRLGLLLWLLLAPAESLYGGGISLPVGLPDITFPRVAALVVAVALVLQARLAGRRLAPIGAVEKVTVAFITVLLLDLFFRGRSFGREALITFDERAIPLLFFVATRNLCASRKDLKETCYVLAALGAYLALHGIYQYLGHSAASASQTMIVGSGTPYESELKTHFAEGRAVGSFSNAAEYGSVVSLCFLWTLFLALHGSEGLRRLMLLAVLLPMGIAVILSLTRSVWLGFHVSLFLIAVLDRERRGKILLTLAAATVVALVAVWSLSRTETIEERATSLAPIYSRLVMYKAALSMFVAKPVFGHGTGEATWLYTREKYLTSVGSIEAEWGNQPGPPHNVYLATMTQWGLAGLVPYLAIFLLVIHFAFDLRRRLAHQRCLSYHSAGFLVASTGLYMIQGMFVDVPALPYFGSAYFFIAGMIQAQRDVSAGPSAAEGNHGAKDAFRSRGAA